MNNKIVEEYLSRMYVPDFKVWDIKAEKWSDVKNLTDWMVLYQDGCFNLHPFTGLVDKGKNKIYFLDKVEIYKEPKPITYLVTFGQGCYRASPYFFTEITSMPFNRIADICTITGSIYDIPGVKEHLKDKHSVEDLCSRNCDHVK